MYLKSKSATIKKYLVQPDSLEAGAGVSQPPLQLRGNRIYFSFLSFFSFFLSFLSFFFFYLAPVLATDWPRYWLSLLFCWPRYWQRGPGTGFLCFFAGPGTGQEAPVLAFYVSLLAPVLAVRPRYWPWRRPPGWLIAMFTCRQYCVIK